MDMVEPNLSKVAKNLRCCYCYGGICFSLSPKSPVTHIKATFYVDTIS